MVNNKQTTTLPFRLGTGEDWGFKGWLRKFLQWTTLTTTPGGWGFRGEDRGLGTYYNEQTFFLLLAAKVRSSCEEGPGQSALQSAYHNPHMDETELKQNRTTKSFRPKIANKQIHKLHRRRRWQIFFLLHAAKVRSSCEEGPGQSALQSAYHNPKLDVTELKQNRTP